MSYQFNPFTGTFDIVGGGSATPGGSNTQVQFNDGGTLGGASQLVYDKAQSFTGVQKSNPQAPLHVTGAIGAQITPPTSLTATLVEDTPVTSPTSASVSVVYGPVAPSTPSVSLIQIDYVTSCGISQDTSYGNYICNGQTIYYQVYGYKNVGGVRVVHPSYYSVSFTDTINDGTTMFNLNLTGFSVTYGNIDGILIAKSYDGGYTWPYSVDAGYVSSYSDNDFTNTDAFKVSQYVENGGNWTANVAQYDAVAGSIYSSNYTSNYTADANQSQALVISVSTGTLSAAGFIIQQQAGNYIDIGTATSYYDWGNTSGTISPYTPFSSVAFPIMSTSLTGSSSSTASFNYGTGAYIATGSTWKIYVWEYRTHPETNLKWFVASPDVYALGTDNNSSSAFDIAWSITPGDGDGRVIVVNQDGFDIYESDVGNATSGNLSGTSSINAKPDIITFTGIYRSFSLYGKIVYPTVKYSVSGYTYAIACPNSAPYALVHSLPSPGNATYFKIIETSYRIGSCYDSGVTSTFYQLLNPIGSSTVTPSSVGFLANGTNLNRSYSVYSIKSIFGVTVYSATAASTTTTDPNNGKYYSIVLSWPGIVGATYKLKRTVGSTSSYHNESYISYTDSLIAAWSDSSTLTPTSGPTTGAIIERSCTSMSNPATLTLRNLNASNLNFAVFDFLSGSTLYEAGRYGVNSAGNFFIQSAAGDLIVGTANNYTATIGTTNILNQNQIYGGYFQFKSASNGFLAYFSAANDTAFFGTNAATFGSDPQCTVYIQPKDSSDYGLVISPHPSASDAGALIKLTNNSSSTYWSVTNGGRMSIRGGSTNNGNLYIGAGDSSTAQIQLSPSSSLANTSGSITFYNNCLWGGDNSGVMRKFAYIPLSYTSNGFAYIDTSGQLVADNKISWSGTYLNVSVQVLFQAGLTISTNQTISLGAGSQFAGGMRLTYAAKSANYTINQNDYLIHVTASGKTMTLPTSVSKQGQVYIIKAAHTTGTTTVNTTSSQTIFTTSAVTSITLIAGDTLRVMADGANWIAI